MEQNNVSVPVTPVAPVEKKSNGMLIAVIICAILAVGGIGFGVWAMMDGNSQKGNYEEQIRVLESRNDELQEIIDGGVGGTNTNIEVRNNPVIKSTNSEEKFALSFYSSAVYWDASGDYKSIMIRIDENQNVSCQVSLKGAPVEDCVISGLEGSVYRIVEFGSGQDNVNNNVGFIMTDGSVKYLPLYDSVINNNYSIRGNVKLDGFVVDAFDVAVSPTNSPVGGYAATVFVFRDGSYEKFDKSMLE